MTKFFNYFPIIFPWMRVYPFKICLVPSLIEIGPVVLGEWEKLFLLTYKRQMEMGDQKSLVELSAQVRY